MLPPAFDRERFIMKQIMRLLSTMLILAFVITGVCVSASALVIFEGDFGFEVNTSKHEAKLVSYSGTGGSVMLPAYYLDYPVTVIGRNAFSGNEAITEVALADTNTTIEEYAFMNCSSLETVSIPESVVSVGDRAFANCTSLHTVTMLSDIVSMPMNMFSGCSALADLTLSETIVDFGYGCFNGCSSLTDLGFVSGGVMLDSYAFSGTGAESVVLSDSLLAIPNYAFTDCSALTSVKIPESVVLIQPYAFDWENVTIRCYPDSFAHSFAEGNGFSYELIDTYLLGDADSDGVVSVLDVTTIQRLLATLSLENPLDEQAADADGSNRIEITDATLIQRCTASIETPYAINTRMDR